MWKKEENHNSADYLNRSKQIALQLQMLNDATRSENHKTSMQGTSSSMGRRKKDERDTKKIQQDPKQL